MLLTIILLSKNDDTKLKKILKKFIRNPQKCRILIMDFSKPREEIKKLIKLNKNIQIQFRKNEGIYKTLNSAINIISTPYYLVAGLDDDIDFKSLDLFLIDLKK